MISLQTAEPRRPETRPTWSQAYFAWAALIAASIGVGFVLRGLGWIRLDFLPPLHAHPRWPSWGLLPVLALAAFLLGLVPRVAAWRWRPLLVAGWALAALWAVALATSDGLAAVAAPMDQPGQEYLPGLPAMGSDPLRWLRGFTEALPAYPTHVKGHPPLPMLILWTMQWLGLGGAGWAAALVIGVGAAAVPAILITVREVADEDTARRAMPFLVLAPYAVWVATSMDALFLGVGAWGVALLALACRSRAYLPAALGAGLLFGAVPYLSYGLLSLFALPLAVVILLRPPRPVLAAFAGAALVVPVAFTAAGFWWFDGLAATHQAWAVGGGAHRPYFYFLVGDLAVLALITGPAVARALPSIARTLRSPVPMLVGAALLGVLSLDVAGVTRGEVERIWLPYAAWVVTAAAVHRSGVRGLLIAQVVTAVALQAFVRSPW